MSIAHKHPRFRFARFAAGMVLGVGGIAAVIFVGSLYIRFAPGYAILIGIAASALAHIGNFVGIYCGRLSSAMIATLLSASIYASYHVMHYHYFRHQAIEVLTLEQGVGHAEASAQLDRVLSAQTGSAGMVGYLQYVSRQGSVLSTRSGSVQIQLDQSQTYVVWQVELLIVLVLPGVIFAFGKKQRRLK